jgi:hypothetical protein
MDTIVLPVALLLSIRDEEEAGERMQASVTDS